MAAEGTQLLEQLRDIHVADAPSWWPPAPGWWLLAALALVLMVLVVRAALRRFAAYRRRRAWLRALDELRREHDPGTEPREYLAALSRLFRAVALRAFPAESCARLEGEEWVRFIAARLSPGNDADRLAALARGPWAPDPEFDPEALEALARRWVKNHG